MLAPRGHSPTPDPEQGQLLRPRLQSRDPQAKHDRRWGSSIRVFMYHRRRLLLLLLLLGALLALAAGGSAVLQGRLSREQDEADGAGSSGGELGRMVTEGLNGDRSAVEAALAAKRPKSVEMRRKQELEEEEDEEDELEKLLEEEEDWEAEGEESEEEAAASGVKLNGAMEKMRQRKQALKDYAKTAQMAADDVRKAAGQPAHKPLPPGAIAGDLLNGKGATPPPRDAARGLWSERAVEWTREHWLKGRSEEEEAALTEERREAVHAAVLHAWGGYKQFAWGMDELQPVAQKGQNWFGLGLTLIDSLDLLYLLGETEEFKGAAEWVAKELNPSVDVHVNVFEVTIRVLGGLLSAYHLSGETAFLEKAKELSNNLRPAMESPSGVPWSDAILAKKSAFAPASAQDSSVSEATSIQLEFKSLAHTLDDELLYRLAERSMRAVDRARSDLPPGELSALVPMFINARTGKFAHGSTITLGARGDSYYEYLLKQWLLTGKQDDFYRDLYNEAVAAIKSKLLRHSEPRGLAYIAELQGGTRFSPKMDHLVCYLPGTLALGVHHGLDESHLSMAKDLMASCFAFYNSTATGLAPEIAYFTATEQDAQMHPDFDLYIQPRDTHNILRPETVESLFYLWRVTKDPVYREWGWRIFQAFETYSKIPTGGYSGLQNVNSLDDPRTDRMDKMESFFLGETLKYFVLLFGDDSLLSLDDYVLNTEAHPLPVFTPEKEWVKEKPEEEWLPASVYGHEEGEGPMAPLVVEHHGSGGQNEHEEGDFEGEVEEEEEEEDWEAEELEEEGGPATAES